MATSLTESMQSDKDFITGPDKGGGWPKWPLLPMKRSIKHSGPDAGTIVDLNPLDKEVNRDHECFRTVYMVCIWDKENFREKFNDPANKLVYESIEAMLLDGWQVD